MMSNIEILEKLNKSRELLKDSLDFMNNVPNKIFGENYIIASNINKFLKSLDEDKTDI